jgi:hypothetical protein
MSAFQETVVCRVDGDSTSSGTMVGMAILTEPFSIEASGRADFAKP